MLPTVVKPVEIHADQVTDVPATAVQKLAPFQAAFTLGLLAATWRLWLPDSEFPKVPLVSWLLSFPDWLTYAAIGSVVVACVGAIFFRSGIWLRWVWGLVGVGFGVLFLLDQHRLQPWAYETTLVGILLACGRASNRDRWLRCLVISVYAYSAIGKFDYQFLHTLGQQFLQTLAGWIWLDSAIWPKNVRTGLASLFPIGELIVAILLAVPRTRRAGVVLAILLHASLVLILGPLGLGHRLGVLLWNGFFAVQAWVLFWPRANTSQNIPAPQKRDSRMDAPAEILPDLAAWFAYAVLAAAIVLPALNFSGRWDHWLSWGLYSPGNSRALVFVTRSALSRIPEATRETLVQQTDRLGDATESDNRKLSDDSPWVELRIDRWSLASTGAPLYPQDRFQLGVAIAVAERFNLADKMRVVLETASDRATGRRDEKTLVGLPQMKMAASKFFWNAIPYPAEVP